MKELIEVLIGGIVTTIIVVCFFALMVCIIGVTIIVGIPLAILSLIILALCYITDCIQDVLRK